MVVLELHGKQHGLGRRGIVQQTADGPFSCAPRHAKEWLRTAGGFLRRVNRLTIRRDLSLPQIFFFTSTSLLDCLPSHECEGDQHHKLTHDIAGGLGHSIADRILL